MFCSNGSSFGNSGCDAWKVADAGDPEECTCVLNGSCSSALRVSLRERKASPFDPVCIGEKVSIKVHV